MEPASEHPSSSTIGNRTHSNRDNAFIASFSCCRRDRSVPDRRRHPTVLTQNESESVRIGVGCRDAIRVLYDARMRWQLLLVDYLGVWFSRRGTRTASDEGLADAMAAVIAGNLVFRVAGQLVHGEGVGGTVDVHTLERVRRPRRGNGFHHFEAVRV